MIFFILLLNFLFPIDNYYYPYPDNPPANVYQQRRDDFRKHLFDGQVYLAFSSDFYTKEQHTKFRQNSDIMYLTGYGFKVAILFMSPDGFQIDGKTFFELLYVKKQDNMDKMWNGTRPNKEQIKQFSGIQEVFWDNEIDVNTLFANKPEMLIAPYTKGENFAPYKDYNYTPIEVDIPFIKNIQEKNPFLIINIDIKKIKLLREIKDKYEINLLRKAVDISVEAHKEVISQIDNIKYEYEIEGIMEGEFKRLGAENTAYNSIVGSGLNSCVLHYTTNRDSIHNNDLILFDCGAEYHGYAADITRTIPKSGKFNQEQKIIYEIVLNAQKLAINHCKPGVKHSSVDSIARAYIDSALIDLGLIETTAESRRYFPHGTSHYLGLDVHDVGTYTNLQEGNVITVEPGIYIPEGSDCDKKWWNIGVRIEDDILITKDGYDNLSKNLVKEIHDIEELIKK